MHVLPSHELRTRSRSLTRTLSRLDHSPSRSRDPRRSWGRVRAVSFSKWGLRPVSPNGNATDAARMAGCRSTGIVGRKVVSRSIVRAALDPRMATAATAANEVLARVADVASCDLLDFLPATGRECPLSNAAVNRRGPPSMPRAELVTALPTRRGSTCYEKLRSSKPPARRADPTSPIVADDLSPLP